MRKLDNLSISTILQWTNCNSLCVCYNCFEEHCMSLRVCQLEIFLFGTEGK